MFVFVSGAARSGKSAWAEEYAQRAARSDARIYLATARVFDQEMRDRVALHRTARKDRGFLTLERPSDLSGVVPLIPAGATVLLECLGTWTANELFDDAGRMTNPRAAFEKIHADSLLLRDRVKNLLIVSNDIFSDGIIYGGETEKYREILGALHVRFAAEANLAVECAAGCATIHRGGEIKHRHPGF
jgi:adenosylcobinamide kinase/adenosylcobinamide-phosphate guanylyltransferase